VTTPRFPRLFSPLTIGSVTLPNRIVSSGHDAVMAVTATSVLEGLVAAVGI
jgi:2,4-dienoyl-CoA reductase-like NADH-dependent reductase (Old Yellow Enzyme family)